jgi:hypothetical protein
MNKYQVYIDSPYYDRSDGLYSTLGRNNRASDSVDSKTMCGEFGFFSDDQYKEHSKQLVDALSEWANQIKFVSCKYENGELQIRNDVLWRPGIPYMGPMLQHLDSAYKDSFPDVDQIQNQRNAICSEIRDLMMTHFDPLPHKPSFDMLINSQIKKSCPNLKKITDVGQDIDLTNFYSHNKICKIVFECVRDKCKLDLTIRPSPFDGFDLARWGATVARGDKESVSRLKSVMEQLVLSEEIHSIMSQYHELKRKLDNDQNIIQFNYVVAQFHEYIHAAGPNVLGGPGSCDLCSGATFKII